MSGVSTVRYQPSGHPHSSSVARSSVVRSSTATPGRLPSASSSSHRSLDTGSTAPPRPFKPEASRVEIVGQALRQQDFSEQVAERAACPQRESTLLVYESKWRRFVGWCSQRKVDTFTASVAVVGDFLLHLFDQKLAISTLEGYRMAIANTLRSTSNIEVGRCDTLKALIRNLHIDRVRTLCPLPDWDLSLVLRRLRLPPFKPLRSCALQLLTWKTVFLLALASGKRRSELHAFLFATFARAEDWSSVSFSVSPSFLAKTALADRGARSRFYESSQAMPTYRSYFD